MKTKRELQFLTYLDALERGDAEGISAFLALAEADAELEKMMMDYHSEASPEEKPKVITPLKRKREDANRWVQRFGSGMVAALMMAMVGLAGIFIGAGGLKDLLADGRNIENAPNATATFVPTATFTPTAAANAAACVAEIASEDNTIMLLPDGDVNRSMTVGVNNPFVINPVTNRGIVGYDAFFEGLRVTVGLNSINLRGDCTSTSSAITVYPKDDANKSCTIEAESLTFPFVKTIEVENNVIVAAYNIPYEQEQVLLDAPVDGIYPIVDSQFDGGIPVGDIQISSGCTSFPLLFTQPSASTSGYEIQPIALTAFHVNEQAFEHGRLFYIPAINQVLIACETGLWTSLPPQAPTASQNSPTPPEGFFEAEGNFVGLWQSLPNTPIMIAVSEGGERRNIYCDLGWAISDLMVYKAAYHHTSDAYYEGLGITRGEHRFTSSTGDVYIFNEIDGSWHIED